MLRVLSTYLFSQRKLTAEMLREARRAEIEAVELFCARPHFDYRSAERARELASWLSGHQLTLHSIHSPILRELSPGRESSAPLSICDPERVRRLEAVDEVKRALDMAEYVPFRYCVQHVASERDIPDGRRWDAAFSSLEHLSLFAKQRGVTVIIENTPGEMATPVNLKNFISETRLTSIKFCFDTGHAHLGDGAVTGLESMRELLASTHANDNRGERDDHLLPYEGTIEWDKLLPLLPADAPIVLELKEPASATGSQDLQAFRATIDGARNVFEKFERALQP